ncbi:uncharacterized protein [Parasteatoda tepidariorum]|uniref:uncharacterized protein n=1 Tax=Parasteatoda tepidariorum TaxID=114398 RepID=UPI001C71C971|nr:uncharacterized protein LOC107453835 [Parasteatoda tepidariorum]
MAIRYPVDDWLHVFSDGSQFDCHFNVGAGVFSELFSFYVPAGYIGTAFDGEVVTLSTALQQLLALQHKFENAVLFSDSQATIQSFSSYERPLTPEISRCQDLLRSLFLRGKRIFLQWVPAHCGVLGNEQADLLTKKGANLLQQPNTATSFWKIKLFLKNLCKTNSLPDLQTRTALKSWRNVSSSLIPDKPRRDAIEAFRLYTGHDCLSDHLYRIGLSTTPFCPLCKSGEKLGRDHLLLCGPFMDTLSPQDIGKQENF